MASKQGGEVEVTGPAYYRAREEARGETAMELRRMCRQLRRWRAVGPLGPNAAEGLRAVEDELRSRSEELPS